MDAGRIVKNRRRLIAEELAEEPGDQIAVDLLAGGVIDIAEDLIPGSGVLGFECAVQAEMFDFAAEVDEPIMTGILDLDPPMPTAQGR